MVATQAQYDAQSDAYAEMCMLTWACVDLCFKHGPTSPAYMRAKAVQLDAKLRWLAAFDAVRAAEGHRS